MENCDLTVKKNKISFQIFQYLIKKTIATIQVEIFFVEKDAVLRSLFKLINSKITRIHVAQVLRILFDNLQ